MPSIDLDLRDRRAAFSTLEQTRFDLLVIGAGITGAGIARDAALRGLSVALIEARDFASGASSRSSKMIHGGLRYLAQGDVGLVKEAASERQILRRIAPHLARLSPFVMPTPNLAVTAKLRAALWSFEKLGGVPKDEEHEVWSAAELRAQEPLVRTDGVHAAVVYPEFLTDDGRLTLANVRSAHAAGAVVLNYAPAVAVAAGEVVCRSALPGEAFEARIRAKAVVNAAGAWVDALRRLESPQAAPKLSLSRGIHLVVPHARVPLERTVIMRARDKRNVFAVPRGAFTYIGTTDNFYDASDYWPRIEGGDVEYLLDAARNTLATEPLKPSDIVSAWAGLRPLIAQPGKSASEVSRKDEVWTGPEGVITIAGGKLSAYRAMAERVADLVEERLGRRPTPAVTGDQPLPGGDGDPRALAAQPALAALGAPAAARLVQLYGSEALAVAQAGGDPAAEAERAVLAEGAATLEDYWSRRSGRAWFDDDAGRHALRPAADRMATLLGWSAAETEAQVEACLNLDAASRAAFTPQSQDA